MAAADSVAAAAADRAPPAGESAGWPREAQARAPRHGQRPRPALHQQLCGPRDTQSLQRITVCPETLSKCFIISLSCFHYKCL